MVPCINGSASLEITVSAYLGRRGGGIMAFAIGVSNEDGLNKVAKKKKKKSQGGQR